MKKKSFIREIEKLFIEFDRVDNIPRDINRGEVSKTLKAFNKAEILSKEGLEVAQKKMY